MPETPLTVLVVEDSQVDAHLIRQLLTRHEGGASITLLSAGSLGSAVDLCHTHRVDVVLLDLGLPDSEGLETFERFKLHHPHVPVVILSAHKSDRSALSAVKAGAQEYLVKGGYDGALLSRSLHHAIQRHQLLRSFQESETRYRVLIENTQELIQSVSRDGSFNFVNKAWHGALGYDAEELSDIDAEELIRPEDRLAYEAVLARVLRGQTAKDVRLTFVTKTGRQLVAEGNISPSYHGGEVTGSLGFFRDVTERDRLQQEAQHALQAATARERQTAALLRAARSILSERSFEATAHNILTACQQLTGATATYIASRDGEDHGDAVQFVHPGSGGSTGAAPPPLPFAALQEAAYQSGEPCFDNAPSHAEQAQLLPAGHPRLRNVLLAPLNAEGHAIGLIVLANKPTDFDERDARVAAGFSELAAIALVSNRTGEALRRSEEQYRTLVQKMLEGVCAVDAAGRCTYVSPRLAQMLSYEPDELLGRHLVDFIDPDSRDEGQLTLSRQRAGMVEQHDFDFLRKDGTRVSTVLSWSPQHDRHGHYSGGIVTVLDVTERRQMQVQLAQSDRMASVGLLAAGVAHEINNPLTYVLFNLQSLAAALPQLSSSVALLRGELDPRRRQELLGEREKETSQRRMEQLVQMASEALEGVERVRDIVGDLRTFSRAEDERQVATCINDVIEGALNMAFNEIKYRARVERHYGDIPDVTANDGKLAQVFLNLIVNAAQSIDEGHVEHNCITVRTLARGGAVLAEVSDTGCGIERHQLGRLFDPFFTTKAVGEGSGLGLSICKNIVESYGGRIEVESRPDEGSTFRVWLPLDAAGPGLTRKPSSDLYPQVLRRARILVVDDEPFLCRAIVHMLADDHDVTAVQSGEVAQRRLAEEQPYDAIICDLMMPDVTGMDLHDWLSQHAPQMAERMLFITGGAFTARAKAFLARVPNPRLEKPFAPKALLVALQQLLQQEASNAPD